SQARLLGVAAAANVVAASHDVLARGGIVRGPMLLEHTAVGFAFAMSYVLLHRFARASTELERKKAELDRMYEELRQTQEKLVRKEQLAAVGELSAVIAHEVRNPLAVIKNAVSGLRRGNLAPDDRATLLDILDEETGRLNRLMHDLLAYARPVVPKGRELSVDELVRRAVERAASGVPHADAVEVVYDLAGPPTVHGDPELLRHALVNVVENALQAMPAGGTLTVRSSDATLEERVPDVDPLPAVALSFADTGEGMDTLVRAKARDPFFTTRSTGTGLGLAIVERVVRNHGGEVDIESLHGVGTTITFVLPRRRPAAGVVPVSEGGRRRRLSGIREAP
ncbi:MAG TPA: ATP-binding protein, partial [Polyangiaceae bacterium LLY-WYZ-15_(1-7)]|nr:ATP-binding protein [Polyangiaceae bacterium LLY-WYZ-15_(1-7)]